MNNNWISELENIIGYTFNNKNYLITALTHSSFAYEHPEEDTSFYERCEFLGDAVLEFVSSDFLYKKYTDLPEGKLTKLRASLVCEMTLAVSARDINLQKYIRLGKGEECNGGRERDSIISDVLEAVIGAIYLDSDIVNAGIFIRKFVLNDIENKQLFTDSKTILQELCQERFGNAPTYKMVGEEGPDHDKTFCCEVYVDGECFGFGKGKNKKRAEQMSAYEALKRLKEL